MWNTFVYASLLLAAFAQVPDQNLFIVGGHGYTSMAHHTVEVVCMSGESKTDLADFPAAREGSVGTYIDGRPMVCGGYIEGPVYSVKDCLTYDRDLNMWEKIGPMVMKRSAAAAIQLSPTKWWVTGGHRGIDDSNGGPGWSSTEVFTVGEGFSLYGNLPEARYFHTLVRVNSTHIVLLGGQMDTEDSFGSAKVWIFNQETETWATLPDLLRSTKTLRAGLVTYSDGRKEIVATGGDYYHANLTQIFSFGTNEWRFGPDFPGFGKDGSGGGSSGYGVPYGDSFLVLGAGSGENCPDEVPKSIYTFDAESENWGELPERMAVGRCIFAAFTVPNSVACV